MKLITPNKIGLFVMLFHWLLCVLAVLQRGGLTQTFHFWYEPLLLQVLAVLDLVWIILAETIWPTSGGSLNDPSRTLFTGFFVAGLQWFLIGRFIGKIKTKKMV